MTESASHTSDVTASMADDVPRTGAATAMADKSACPTWPEPRLSPLWLIVPCLACDFLMVPVISSLNGPPSALHVALVFGIVGCVLAQGCLLAAFLAWSDGPFLRRLLMHWLIAAGLYLVWLVGLGLALAPDPEWPNIAKTVALGVPLVSVAAQFPLWLARQWWGWRLVRGADIPVCHIQNPLPLGEGGRRPGEVFEQDADPAANVAQKLAIRHLMLATAVVAVSLALARLAPLDGNDKDAGPVWLVACTVAAVISSITLLPAGKLLMRRRLFRPGLIWSILYAAAWIALVWLIVAAKFWFFPRALAPRAVYVGISSLIFTFAATLILTALLARTRGYRLTGGRRRVTE